MAAEKIFENKVKKHLADHGAYFVKFFANSFTKKGVPDVLCCLNGYFIGIELKAPDGRPTELQKEHRRQIQAAGGISIILYPDQFDDFRILVRLITCGHMVDAVSVEKIINERTK